MFKITIDDAYTLQDRFIAMNRDYYSIEGYEALLELSDEVGGMELDVIAICCDFTEAAPEDIAANYGYMMTEEELKDEDKLMDFLNYHSWAVKLDNGNILYQNF